MGKDTIINFDSMAELELNLQQHVDQMVKMIIPKLENATAKRAPAKFINDALKGLSGKLSMAESEQLHKTCKEMHAKRKKADQEEKANKLKEEEAKKKAEKDAKAAESGMVNDEDFFKDFM